jgi:hypothetical protein
MYKTIPVCIAILLSVSACRHPQKPIVSSIFIDSLITRYQPPLPASSNDSALLFWKNRINRSLPGITSESKYAACLSYRFHLFGDIRDIQTADSVLRKLDSDFNHKEASADLTLLHYAVLQHRFKEADRFLEAAKQAGLKKYDLLTSSFDVDFEMGRYFDAANELKALKSSSDYGYFFRRSKMDHLNGLLDSAIGAMLKSAEIEATNPYLQQVALSNAADLCIHAGELDKAARLYLTCLKTNPADFHSLMGLGWIALVADKNDSLAGKIFSFVQSKNKLPDPLFKLTQMAQSIQDSALEKKYARAFASSATQMDYGNMYNRYLIELYTGILYDPARAEEISKRELGNRNTPQTWAWYAWCLFSNHKKEEAYSVFQKYISGRPLEGLELYWMGKMMQGMNKEFNAQAFYAAAFINKYDLSPSLLRDLEKQLN